MGMEIHAAIAVLCTLNTNFFSYIDLNNHLISFIQGLEVEVETEAQAEAQNQRTEKLKLKLKLKIEGIRSGS